MNFTSKNSRWATVPGIQIAGPNSAEWGTQPLLTSSNDGKRKVRVRRRRRSSSEGNRERAEASRRDRPSSQSKPTSSSKPPSGGGTTRPPSRPPSASGSGGGMRLPPVVLIGIVLLFVCAFIVMTLFGGDDSSSSGQVFEPVSSGSAEVSSAESQSSSLDGFTAGENNAVTTNEEFVAPVFDGEGDTWLIMMYQDADDKVLEQDIHPDLNEAERIGSSDNVHIVAQVDRYRGGYSGDGNWTGTKRFYIGQDRDLGRITSEEVMDIGEVNMSDGQTLVDFVTWAVETFPADKHVLIMSDHGMGWPGGWTDPDTGGQRSTVDRSIPLTQVLGDELYLMELDEALTQIRAETGIDKFELIGMDACLMGHLEVFSALEPHARYAVASQETEPALGWAYTGFLRDLLNNPNVTGADLGRYIVDSYISEDQRIVDDQARAEFARGGLFGAPSAQQVAAQLGQNSTLTAIDLQQIPQLVDSVNNLSYELQDANQRAVSQARQYSQSFTSIFGKSVPPSYIDLGHFAALLKQQTRDSDITAAADGVIAALNQAVIAEKHGAGKPGATGVSVYFPNSQLYSNPQTGPQSYNAVAERFVDTTLWDDFLAYHYTGRSFNAAAATAPATIPDIASVRAPAGGGVTVTPVKAASSVAAPDQPVLLTTDISGDNIGYVYLFVGLYDEQANSIWVADSDYLESPNTVEVNGVYYPDWGEGEFTMEFEWEPFLQAIDDGTNSVVALFTPETYGAGFEDAMYTVDGIYHYGDGEERYARLYFRDGELQQVFGFTGENGSGAPREIVPKVGDSFTVLEKWYDLDAQGRVANVAAQEGGTLTFGEEPWTWVELDAPVGNYVVGFIVEDLDGNPTQTYAQIAVE